MTRSPDRLFDLLPVVHRRRDAEQGHPLRALLQVIAEQVDVVEGDLERLYDNWFIETCEDWVVPYLGELIGYPIPLEAGAAREPDGVRSRLLAQALVPRREVANTLAYRRRKGTLALLERLAHDIAGWPARAVEFYRLLAWTQALEHQRLHRSRTVDLRDGDRLDGLDGPFDALAHTVDVRRLAGCRTLGRHNIPGVGVFVWRLEAYPITRAPAYCLEAAGTHCYTFSVLGNDTPLFTRPRPEPSPEHIAGPLEVPTSLSRRAVERNLAAYYGEGSSFSIWVDGWAGHASDRPLTPEALIVADLSGWSYRPPRDRVAVDPVLGRLAFPPRQLPRKGVWVGYHYGFSADLGAGEYPRALAQPADAVVYRVGADAEFVRIHDALVRWREERPRDAVLELTDGGVYVEQIDLELDEGQSFQLRAADRTRPVLRLMDWQTARPDALSVRGAGGSRFTLDGVLVAGRSVRCEGPLAEVVLRHCTLVPGWTIESGGEPGRPVEPSLELIDTGARVVVEHTILGSIQVSQDEVAADPATIRIADSILDATDGELEAIGAPSWPTAHAVLTIERTTVLGAIEAHAIELAQDSVFTGRVHVARRQRGCMRFCFVPPRSRTPRRYRCQPDLAEQGARDRVPRREVGPDGAARFVVGGGAASRVGCPAPEEAANLELDVEVSHAAPQVGQELVLTVSLHNRGPHDAAAARVDVTGPPSGCLRTPEDADVADLVILSQGTVTTDGDERLVWDVGALAAGASATLTARAIDVANEEGACEPIATVRASVSSWTFEGTGRPFLDELVRRVRGTVRPRFSSVRYGSPGYGQLAATCREEITRGASDESEMGAFHDLFQAQRAANLQARLDEFTPAGMVAGIIYAT
jgi:hypothetical protein